MSGGVRAFIDRLDTHGDKPAFIHRDRTCGYRELAERVRGASAWLDAHGVGAGSAVMLCGDFSPGAVGLLLALCGRSCIVLPQTAAGIAKRAQYASIGRPEWVVEVDEATDEPRLAAPGWSDAPPLYAELRRRGHAGIVVFSSGSSGAPKGIVHDAEPLVRKYGPGKAATTASFLLFDHLGGINTLLHVLARGGCLVALPDRAPDRVAAAIERHRVEILPTTPTFLGLLMVSGAHLRHDLGSLRLVTYGTEPMPAVTLARLREALPQARLGQTYGLSEVGVLASRSESSDSLWMRLGGDGFETRVVDGILQIKARSSMLGYLNAPSPFTEDGWLVTGDRVEVRGEMMRVLGRACEMINVGGEKVFPAEVEQVILEAGGVEEATVHAKSNPLLGQTVWARVKLAEGVDAKAAKVDILRHCHARLERFKVPVGLTFTGEALHGERFKKERSPAEAAP